MSHRNRKVAAKAPISCAATNRGASAGWIPAKVSDQQLAIVTAGFANEVDAVNQITDISPNVATNSLRTNENPCREWVKTEYQGKPNIRCAMIAPATPPAHCTAM
jgi:hypothetical protein